MIAIRCSTPTTLKLSELQTFQGGLKKRTTKDIEALSSSIKTDGLIMPLAVWKTENGNLLLDGHGRLAALTELALEDSSIVELDIPVVYVQATTEAEAKKALLQITSSYGRIAKDGAIKFCSSIPEYRAPCINRYMFPKQNKRKTETLKTETIIRITVPTDKVEQVKELFSQVSFIKVL